MKLKLKDIQKSNDEVRIDFNSSIDDDTGLLLITINVGIENYSPYHWFFEDGKKPPLDIAINPDSGCINYIKFFLQDEKVIIKESKEIKSDIRKTDGIPTFDISVFDDRNYQMFENSFIISSFIKNDLYFLVESKNIDICIDIDSRLSLFFDKDDLFSGFAIKDLKEAEIKELHKSDVL